MAWPKKRNPAYDKPEWRRARKAQLERDGWRCQIRLPGCLGTKGGPRFPFSQMRRLATALPVYTRAEISPICLQPLIRRFSLLSRR